MRIDESGIRVAFAPLVAAAMAGAWVPAAFGQAPPVPSPAPPAVADSPAQLAERLRRMEGLNQDLLRQFQGMSQQIQDLSRRLEESERRRGVVPGAGAAVGGDGNAPSLTESAARPSRSSGPTPVGSTNAGMVGAVTGADDTAPLLSESAARPSRAGPSGPTGRLGLSPLGAYYDQRRYGFLIASETQEFELRVNALLQVDSRTYAARNQAPVVNDFDIPRARVYFSGRMTRPVEYQLSFQRGTNTLDVLNAYLNFHYDDRLQFRAGRFKPPYTFEWYKATAWELPTPERSPFALNFGPNRQVGFMGWGFLFRERLEYAVALTGGGRNSYQDFNNAKDLMALLDYKPFYQSGSPALKNFAIGGSVDQGKENNPLIPAVLRTSINASGNSVSAGTGDSLVGVPFLAFNSNARERGDRQLWELHTTYFYKGLSLLGAWDSGHNDFALTSAGARPVHLPVSGFFTQAAYLLTGETRERLSLIDPLRPFDLRRGRFGPGAFEVQARYSALTLGNQVFTHGLADPNLWSDRVGLVDLGFNWYPNKFTKFYFDWEHAAFGQPVLYRPGPGLQKTSDLFWLRLEIYL